MKHAIQFLEQMGQDATLRYASDSNVEAAMTAASLAPALRQAIVSRDARVLEELLGAPPNVCCMIQAEDNDVAEAEHN